MAKKYTEDELRKASDHLYYEIWMVKQLAEILEKGSIGIYKAKSVTQTSSTDSIIFVRGTSVAKITNVSSPEESEEEYLRVINNALMGKHRFSRMAPHRAEFLHSLGVQRICFAALRKPLIPNVRQPGVHR